MSWLVVQDLKPGIVVKQRFCIKRDTDIKHIRIGIYKHRNTVANLKLSLYQDDTLLATFKEITATELNETMTEDFHYGLVRFDLVDSQFVSLKMREKQTETEYNWRIESELGTDLAYLSVIRKHENQIYGIKQQGILVEQAINDSIEPYYFEIYEYKYI